MEKSTCQTHKSPSIFCFLDHITIIIIIYAVAEARRSGHKPKPSCLKLTGGEWGSGDEKNSKAWKAVDEK